MAKLSSKGKTGVGVIAASLALLVIANRVLAVNSNTISSYLGTSSSQGEAAYTADELYQQGVDVSTQIEEEGSVLLKNENNTLPLASNTSVALLGSMSINYVLGGTGSGGGVDDEHTIMMKDAFEAAGLTVDNGAYEWLAQATGNSSGTGLTHSGAAGNSSVDGTGGGWNSSSTAELELNPDTYSSWTDSAGKTLAQELSSDTKVAIVTFGRTGSEGDSLSFDKDGDGDPLNGTHYLELTDNERALLSYCKENFESTIVLINSANQMELGFIDNENYDVDACLWIGHPGEAGLYGVANVIAGIANPSGCLSDTYVYDMSTMPGYYGNGDSRYTNLEGNNSIWAEESGQFFKTNGVYMYFENIYVGYRYFETADAEGFFDTPAFKNLTLKNDSEKRTDEQLADGGNARKTSGGYDNVVQFPFGYGLSYTTFETEITSSDISLDAHDSNSITVEVTNTGDVAGKKTVQLYMEAPYAQDSSLGIAGKGLEKSARVLIGYAKTDSLEPGESQKMTIEFDTDDLASYDYAGQGCYVLEKGDYTFHVSDDAHTSVDQAEATLSSTMIYNDDGVGKRDSDNVVATNHLDDVSAGDGNNINCDTYLSRSDIASGMNYIMQFTPGLGTGLDLQMGDNQKEAVLTTGTNSYQYEYEYYSGGTKQTGTKTLYNQASTASFNTDTTPDGLSMNDESYEVTFGSTDTSYTLSDMYDEVTGLALDYDDPKWDDLLDQLTMEECITMQGNSNTERPAVESIGQAENTVKDGPHEAGNGSGANNTWFPSEIVLAATFNDDIALDLGLIYGYQAGQEGYSGAYAPAMDTHRSPFGGRNFEYFSEDSFLAGKIGAQEVDGIQSTGTMVYIKHFLLNDNDDNRNGAFTWCNEQAIREVYAKSFELCVKESNALGIMASLNRIGMSSEHYGLYNDIVREEWGFQGHIITDGLGPLASAGQALFNTPSICLASQVGVLDGGETKVNSSQYVNVDGDAAYTTKYGQYMLRKVAKNYLYQYVASGDVNRQIDLNRVWYIAWVAIDVILAAAIVLSYIFLIHRDLFPNNGAQVQNAEPMPANGPSPEPEQEEADSDEN